MVYPNQTMNKGPHVVLTTEMTMIVTVESELAGLSLVLVTHSAHVVAKIIGDVVGVSVGNCVEGKSVWD